MEILFLHYGVDWVAIVLTLIALYRLGNKKRDGFVYGMASNLAWVAFAVLVMSVAALLANVLFIVMNFRGWYRWRTTEAAAIVTGGGSSPSTGADKAG